MEELIDMSYRAMLTNLQNKWTSLDSMYKNLEYWVSVENYEVAEGIKRAINEYEKSI